MLVLCMYKIFKVFLFVVTRSFIHGHRYFCWCSVLRVLVAVVVSFHFASLASSLSRPFSARSLVVCS